VAEVVGRRAARGEADGDRLGDRDPALADPCPTREQLFLALEAALLLPPFSAQQLHSLNSL
jgi:hypothetical protein